MTQLVEGLDNKKIIKILDGQLNDLQRKASEEGLSVLRKSGQLTSSEVRLFRRSKGATVEVKKLVKDFQGMIRSGDFNNYPQWKENFEKVFAKYWRHDLYRLAS